MSAPVVVVECEDGYPTDDGLVALRNHAFDPCDAARFLVYDFPDICKAISCCRAIVTDARSDIMGDPAKRIEFSTGGWSGAEELIGIMLNHFWIRHHHVKWERGGHYEFEVLDHFLDMAPNDCARMKPTPDPTAADNEVGR